MYCVVFYQENGLAFSLANKAVIKIIERSPLRIKVSIENKISKHFYTQTITMRQREPLLILISVFTGSRMWLSAKIIKQNGNYKTTDLHKALYKDTGKLIIIL